MPVSVSGMEGHRARAIANLHELSTAGAAWAASYWFSFGYFYYGSPAVLVEQEVRGP
jgi:hypothetical protein